MAAQPIQSAALMLFSLPGNAAQLVDVQPAAPFADALQTAIGGKIAATPDTSRRDSDQDRLAAKATNAKPPVDLLAGGGPLVPTVDPSPANPAVTVPFVIPESGTGSQPTAESAATQLVRVQDKPVLPPAISPTASSVGTQTALLPSSGSESAERMVIGYGEYHLDLGSAPGGNGIVGRWGQRTTGSYASSATLASKPVRAWVSEPGPQIPKPGPETESQAPSALATAPNSMPALNGAPVANATGKSAHVQDGSATDGGQETDQLGASTLTPPDSASGSARQPSSAPSIPSVPLLLEALQGSSLLAAVPPPPMQRPASAMAQKRDVVAAGATPTAALPANELRTVISPPVASPACFTSLPGVRKVLAKSIPTTTVSPTETAGGRGKAVPPAPGQTPEHAQTQKAVNARTDAIEPTAPPSAAKPAPAAGEIPQGGANQPLAGSTATVSVPGQTSPSPEGMVGRDAQPAAPPREMAAEATTVPAAAPPGMVQSAHIVESPGQSEMHIGLRTEAFGSVEIHTVVRDSQLGLAVGSERGDLKNLLSADVPGLQMVFRQQDLRFDHIRFLGPGQQAGMNFSSGRDSSPGRSYVVKPTLTQLATEESPQSESAELDLAWDSAPGLSLHV